jgi:hypothetical protein
MPDPIYSRAHSQKASLTPAKQLAAFLAKFDPVNAKVIRACRAELRKRLPTAIEIVYDNYNFFVIGYCATERPSSCIVSLVASAKGVALSFYHGARLPDPHGILQGSGKQNRFVRLPSAKTLREPAVSALVTAAVAQADSPLSTEGTGYLRIQSISAKQRSRRKN